MSNGLDGDELALRAAEKMKDDELMIFVRGFFFFGNCQLPSSVLLITIQNQNKMQSL